MRSSHKKCWGMNKYFIIYTFILFLALFWLPQQLEQLYSSQRDSFRALGNVCSLQMRILHAWLRAYCVCVFENPVKVFKNLFHSQPWRYLHLALQTVVLSCLSSVLSCVVSAAESCFKGGSGIIKSTSSNNASVEGWYTSQDVCINLSWSCLWLRALGSVAMLCTHVCVWVGSINLAKPRWHWRGCYFPTVQYK